VLDYAEEVGDGNFPRLNSLFKQLREFFEMPDVKCYVIFNRNQGVFSNAADSKKYVVLDGECLEDNSPSHLGYSEMMFLISKELACLKLGFSRIFCRGQFRNFSVTGVTSIDILSQFAPCPQFLGGAKKEAEYSAAALYAHFVSDRVGLLLCQDVAAALKAVVANDVYIKDGLNFLKSESAAALAEKLSGGIKGQNKDFKARLENILSFYLSDNYAALTKEMQTK
jgi:hypothetical protein